MTEKGTVLDWNEYIKAATEVVSEGCVLLENKNGALPFAKGEKISVFGRIQTHYYKSGTGSGGMVNVTEVIGIPEGLKRTGDVVLNETLEKVYRDWEEKNPFNEGTGWGTEPWSQEEMALDDETVKQAAAFSDTAIVIVGRTAGEDKDFSDVEGAFRLSDTEERMMEKVRGAFGKMVVLLNIGQLMDLSFIDKYSPDAVVLVWQGGMVGGIGTADVLTGRANPSGKLFDTATYSIEDYPSNDCFGDPVKNYYKEDIFVGYRYFETFAKDKVRYPFGYGLSYTDFEIGASLESVDIANRKIDVSIEIKNVGTTAGKEVGQIYLEAPILKLGKPSRVLAGFAKSSLLKPGESEKITVSVPFDRLASFDDSGVTGHPGAFVMEEGEYNIYVGNSVRSAEMIGSFSLKELLVVRQLSLSLGPVEEYERLEAVKNASGEYTVVYSPVPMADGLEEERRINNIPKEIPLDFTSIRSLRDVLDGNISVEEFISGFTDEDLACIVRGEGMGSKQVTPGTAAAFAGVSPHLKKMDIPALCCDDGPSGMRLDSGVTAFSLPSGAMIAATFNPEIVSRMYEYEALEMISNKVEVLLGPGMNIHRHPLNGRNFEYFSEDPYLTGVMGNAMVQGLKKYGVTGCIKHFCGNNQEKGRLDTDSIISMRALREIYLPGFEYAVKNGADAVMTTYGQVNGRWTAGNPDLNTQILRKEWGFEGVVMTDWWAKVNYRNMPPSKNNTAAMVSAQNDLYMVCPDGATNAGGDNTLESIKNGTVTRAEVQRCAVNICNHVAKTVAMKRLMKTADEIEVINKPKYDDDIDLSKIESVLSKIESNTKASYVWQIDVQRLGKYSITLTGSSELGELAQLPCTFLKMGIPEATFTFNGTGGKDVSITKDVLFWSRFQVSRLLVGSNGLKLKSLKFKFLGE